MYPFLYVGRMSSLDFAFVFCLVLCVAFVFYAYIGYPIVIWCLSRWFGREESPAALGDSELPSVSLLIVAHNEESEIENRILNALDLDYPANKFEIVIASDGSSDLTNQIVRRYASRGVRLLQYVERRGKAAVLNDAFNELNHPLVVLSDANTSFGRESIRHLTAWFADQSIGAVCGRLILVDSRTGQNVDGMYWKYETFLKKCESNLGALLGANGGIYAIRRSLFQGIPDTTIVDDMVIPLLARVRTGCRVVYDRHAVATEETSKCIDSEFHRRARIGAGGYQAIGLLRSLLSPRYGWVSLTFWSHKILRWLCPFLMIGAVISNLCLVQHPFFLSLLYAQVTFYAGSLLAEQLPAKLPLARYCKLCTMFTMMNVALFVGFLRWIGGLQAGTWDRTVRQTDATFSAVQPTGILQ